MVTAHFEFSVNPTMNPFLSSFHPGFGTIRVSGRGMVDVDRNRFILTLLDNNGAVIGDFLRDGRRAYRRTPGSRWIAVRSPDGIAGDFASGPATAIAELNPISIVQQYPGELMLTLVGEDVVRETDARHYQVTAADTADRIEIWLDVEKRLLRFHSVPSASSDVRLRTGHMSTRFSLVPPEFTIEFWAYGEPVDIPFINIEPI
jgi:hypothetical protein